MSTYLGSHVVWEAPPRRTHTVTMHTADAARRATARTTGVLYLLFFVAGIAGTLLVRPELFDADSATTTLANLTEHPTLARVGIALELAIVVLQALTAIWFFRLFHTVDRFAAGALAAFGLVSATAILGSSAAMGTALEVATGDGFAGTSGRAASAQLMFTVSEQLWATAAVFFGLWLLPMGWLVLRSGWMPRLLGWTLLVGGVGYVLSAFVAALVAGGATAAQLLTLPSVVGELWIMAYLLVRGVRRPTPDVLRSSG